MIPNTNLQVGRQRFSELFWSIIGEEDGDEENSICEIVDEQQRLRASADYKTGSVPIEDAIDLFLITKYFQPRVIAEVGTFIGVSTNVMALAAPDAQIHTCDVSNALEIAPYNTRITQYPRTPSHLMFESLRTNGITPDFVYLDGRLDKKDMEEIQRGKYEDTIFVFDDFEGTEKGVTNSLLLDRNNVALIYPRYGHKTAVIIPYSRIEFVRQEMT